MAATGFEGIDAGSRPGSPPSIRGIDHVELFVPDRRDAARWYDEALGLSVLAEYEHWAEDPRGPLMISNDGGKTKLALFEDEPERGRRFAGFRRVAFGADAEAFLELRRHLLGLPVFDERGGELAELPPVDHDGSFSLYFCDPWGHELEVTTYQYAIVADLLGAGGAGG